MLARGLMAAAVLASTGLTPTAEAGEKLRPRMQTAGDAVEYGQQITQTAGVRQGTTVRGGRAPAVANNRGVVGRDPVESVDPLEDPFEDPFAEGVPALPAPKVQSRPAARPPVRSQPSSSVRSQVIEQDEDPQPMPPVVRSQPAPQRRPAPAPVQPAPEPMFNEPTETIQQPKLRSLPRTPASQPQRSRLDEDYVCPNPGSLKKIDQIAPTIVVTGDLPTECNLGEEAYADRSYCELTYQWKASSLCSKPLYFEDEQLERYGRLRHPLLQPVISGGRFFADVATMPYKAGYDRPGDCVYALGYYRPGTCVPGFRYRFFPLEADGVLFEALAVGGFIALIP